MLIREYLCPETLEEAYDLLTKRKTNRIIGGCTFLNRTNINVGTAIDLRRCNLDYILEREEEIAIGAYTSLRKMETSETLLYWYGTALREAMEHLIGVQLRNAITIGAHVASRFGFSDIIPTLLALNALIRFFHRGILTLQDYLAERKPERDILVEILLPRERIRCVVQSVRKSYNDYSAFCLAISRSKKGWTITGGIFPGRAKLAAALMNEMNLHPVKREDAPTIAQKLLGEFTFGTNYRASAEYRREICGVFARRGIEALIDESEFDNQWKATGDGRDTQ